MTVTITLYDQASAPRQEPAKAPRCRERKEGKITVSYYRKSVKRMIGPPINLEALKQVRKK